MSLRGALFWSVLLLAARPLCGAAVAQNASPAGAAMDPQSAIQACVERTHGGETGLTKVAERCPDLPAALQTAGIGPLIIDSSRDRFDRASLLRLATLTH